MKALQCVELGLPDKLKVNEIADPELLPGHVLIENNEGQVLAFESIYTWWRICRRNFSHRR